MIEDMPIVEGLDLSSCKPFKLKTYRVELDEQDGSSGATYQIKCPEAQDEQSAVDCCLLITHLTCPIVMSVKEVE